MGACCTSADGFATLLCREAPVAHTWCLPKSAEGELLYRPNWEEQKVTKTEIAWNMVRSWLKSGDQGHQPTRSAGGLVIREHVKTLLVDIVREAKACILRYYASFSAEEATAFTDAFAQNTS